MMKHLGTSLAVALLAALASAAAVLWMPTLAGKVITGAALAWWIGHHLRKHKLARKGSEALAAGALAVVAALVFLPAAVPLAVFVVCALPSLAHHTNPKRVTVVRTTRGVKSPARRAAGGRAGRPGEKPHTARRSSASAPRTAPRARKDPPAPGSPQKPSQRAAGSSPSSSPWPPPPDVPAASWPHASGDVRPSTFLPWAGEGSGGWGTGSAAPRKLRTDQHRPGAAARALCPDCGSGDCNRCLGRGCECPRSGHPLRPAYVPPTWPGQDDDPDTPPY